MITSKALLKSALMLLVLACALAVSSTPAAATLCIVPRPGGNTEPTGLCKPGWGVSAQSYPTNLPPGGEGEIVIDVLNIGGEASSGPVTVTDTLPPGVVATDAGELKGGGVGTGVPNVEHKLWDCGGTTVVSCTNDAAEMASLAGGAGGVNTPAFSESSHAFGGGPNRDPQIVLGVKVTGPPGTATNRITVTGGGAPAAAATSDPVTIGATPPPGFAIVDSDAWLSNADGTIDTQAGSHPYAATFVTNFATELGTIVAGNSYHDAHDQEVRDIEATLPPGFVGDPTAAPQCTAAELVQEKCPEASQIGVHNIFVAGGAPFRAKVFNMVPPAGAPAEFADIIVGVVTTFDASVRSGGDYGITEHIDNIPRKNLLASVLTIWGTPAEASHDRWRTGAEGGCREENGHIVPEPNEEGVLECVPSTSPLRPFLTMPTACNGPLTTVLRANTWQDEAFGEPVTSVSHDENGNPVGLSGCEELEFNPAITTEPDTAKADTPAGLTVEVRPSVGGLEEPDGVSSSDIENTTVTLPQGLVINPGQAAGLQACSQEQSRVGDGEDDAPRCPLASKVGTDEIETPLLLHSLKGNVYVLQSDPPELKLLVAASGEGVNLKLVGVAHLNERTGQLTTTFEGTPETPFTSFRLAFSGGAQAALDTPTQCGVYGPAQGFAADFTPWSSPFVADAFPTAEFSLTEGPDGGPCPSSPLPFAPSLVAGATTDQAGGFTNFSLLLQRGDGQQRIAGLRFKAPAGLTGELAKVPLCTNAQAEGNACPEASRIGHTIVESGPGPYPLVVPEPGQPPAPIYLTEGYKGAPFGLSVVVPLHVGPFVLPTQRVRAKIEVDPYTSALTVTTDPLPQEVAGVPTDLREVDAVIERPEFMVNPTNCNPQEFSGTAYGTPPPGVGAPGATAAIGSHFQVGACRSLEFAPKFSVSTSGKTSKSQGASLTAKVTYPNVPQGTDADIASVKVELPKQLPSRLTTLQKACTSAQFEANPAGCPVASRIGYATVHTPLLPVPLQGPAIFVSHGGEAFPSLTMVLQGDGVTVDLVGATFISKAGITSTTFKTVPDDPFSTFELTLPQGPYSALTTDGSLCAPTRTVTVRKRVTVRVRGRRRQRKVTRSVTETKPVGGLVMPNEFVAQNGAAIKQDTIIHVTGCARAKVAKAKPRAGRIKKK